MQRTEKAFKIKTDDHFSVNATLYRGSEKASNLIILCSASATPQYYYKNFAAYSSSNPNFDTITFDYRDTGASVQKPLKKCKSTITQWGERDLKAVINWADKKYEKIFFIGHSIGGQILPLASNADRITAAYFVGSQVPYIGLWKGKLKLKPWVFWNLAIPFVTQILGYLPGRVLGSEVDLPTSVAKEWRHWGLNEWGIEDSVKDVRKKYNRLKIPISFLALADDTLFAPSEAVQALMHRYENAKTFYQYIKPENLGLKTIGHFGFFRKEHQEKLWAMPVMFFSQHLRDFNVE